MTRKIVVLAFVFFALSPSVYAKSKSSDDLGPPSAPSMNEMKGKLLSIDTDGKVLRLMLDGGYNMQFAYDSKTRITEGGRPLNPSDLAYNDVLAVRYLGQDLTAVEIVRGSATTPPAISTASAVGSSTGSPGASSAPANHSAPLHP